MSPIRPDAMQLNVVLSCPVFGTTEVGEPDGSNYQEPVTVQINGRFGEVDPLTVEEAQVLVPKLAYLFEALVKEHQARKAAMAQRAALIAQAQAQRATGETIIKTAEVVQSAADKLATEVTATDAEAE